MKKALYACIYALLAACVVIADRLTKTYALHNFVTPVMFNKFISAELVFNRGISWGMLTFDDQRFFMGVSCLIIGVILLFVMYALKRFSQGHFVIGEALVLAGALSNVADRFWYGGVIDFILLSYGSWTFPVFNVADICIVAGIGSMCLFSAEQDA